MEALWHSNARGHCCSGGKFYCVSCCSLPCLCREPHLSKQPPSRGRTELPKPTVRWGTERGWGTCKGTHRPTARRRPSLPGSVPLSRWLRQPLCLHGWILASSYQPTKWWQRSDLSYYAGWCRGCVKSLYEEWWAGLGSGPAPAEKFNAGAAGCWVDCLQALVPGVLPLTQVFSKAPGPEIPAQAHFCLEPSVFTQGRCAAGLCGGAQRDASLPGRLWHEGSLPLLSLPLEMARCTPKVKPWGGHYLADCLLLCPMAVTKERSNFY